MGVLGRGEDDRVGCLDRCAERGDGGRQVGAVGVEERDAAEVGEDFEAHLCASEDGRALQQEQVGGAGAEAAKDGEDAEGRTHFKMIANESI